MPVSIPCTTSRTPSTTTTTTSTVTSSGILITTSAISTASSQSSGSLNSLEGIVNQTDFDLQSQSNEFSSLSKDSKAKEIIVKNGLHSLITSSFAVTDSSALTHHSADRNRGTRSQPTSTHVLNLPNIHQPCLALATAGFCPFGIAYVILRLRLGRYQVDPDIRRHSYGYGYLKDTFSPWQPKNHIQAETGCIQSFYLDLFDPSSLELKERWTIRKQTRRYSSQAHDHQHLHPGHEHLHNLERHPYHNLREKPSCNTAYTEKSGDPVSNIRSLGTVVSKRPWIFKVHRFDENRPQALKLGNGPGLRMMGTLPSPFGDYEVLVASHQHPKSIIQDNGKDPDWSRMVLDDSDAEHSKYGDQSDVASDGIDPSGKTRTSPQPEDNGYGYGCEEDMARFSPDPELTEDFTREESPARSKERGDCGKDGSASASQPTAGPNSTALGDPGLTATGTGGFSGVDCGPPIVVRRTGAARAGSPVPDEAMRKRVLGLTHLKWKSKMSEEGGSGSTSGPGAAGCGCGVSSRLSILGFPRSTHATMPMAVATTTTATATTAVTTRATSTSSCDSSSSSSCLPQDTYAANPVPASSWTSEDASMELEKTALSPSYTTISMPVDVPARPEGIPSGSPAPSITPRQRLLLTSLYEDRNVGGPSLYSPPTERLRATVLDDEAHSKEGSETRFGAFGMVGRRVGEAADEKARGIETVDGSLQAPPGSTATARPKLTRRTSVGLPLPFQASTSLGIPCSPTSALKPKPISFFHPSRSFQPRSIQSASLVGSYEESIIHARMSAMPSPPLTFFAQLGVLAIGKCKPCLRNPPHATLLFPAHFFEYPAPETSLSPYVGSIDLTSGLVGEARFEKHPGMYRIPRRGRIQVLIKNANKAVVKVFLVNYDLRDMQAGMKTFLRQKSYVEPELPASSGQETADDGKQRKRQTLRYMIHLQFYSCPKRRLYLVNQIRVVFHPHGGTEKMKVVYERPPEPVYRPATETSVTAVALPATTVSRLSPIGQGCLSVPESDHLMDLRTSPRPLRPRRVVSPTPDVVTDWLPESLNKTPPSIRTKEPYFPPPVTPPRVTCGFSMPAVPRGPPRSFPPLSTTPPPRTPPPPVSPISPNHIIHHYHHHSPPGPRSATYLLKDREGERKQLSGNFWEDSEILRDA